MKVLVIEDEEKVLNVIKKYLKKEGFEPLTYTSGKKGLEGFYEYSPDLVILDLMLPDIDGEEICKIIKEERDVPIIMLTAKSSVDDRIKGLSIGADDYLIKPFSPRELMMRVKVILKRYSNENQIKDKLSFNDKDLVIDKISHKVYKKNKEVELTPAEYKVFLFMVENEDINLSRNKIIEKVFGIEFDGYDRTIDTHIKNIRRKIEDDHKNPQYIKTVFGFGYKFLGENSENEN